MGTHFPKREQIPRRWYVLDVEGKILGRVASRVASILKGKHKATYTPHIDTGDHVIVINASKVNLTGKKLEQKEKFRHTGWPGGTTFWPPTIETAPSGLSAS